MPLEADELENLLIQIDVLSDIVITANDEKRREVQGTLNEHERQLRRHFEQCAQAREENHLKLAVAADRRQRLTLRIVIVAALAAIGSAIGTGWAAWATNQSVIIAQSNRDAALKQAQVAGKVSILKAEIRTRESQLALEIRKNAELGARVVQLKKSIVRESP